MSFFVQPTTPPTSKTPHVQQVSLLLAAILIIMVVAQLFSFETFNEVVGTLTGIDTATASIWAAGIVTLEVAALPFLLAMTLSPAARVISMVAGWLVAGGWLMIALWDNVTMGTMVNSGLLGATISVPGGWWTVFFSIGLGLLSVWASWGMWPLTARRKK